MPIIVLDGCDVTGKTTLARALLQEVPGSKLLHLTYRWSTKMPLYHLAAFRWALRNREPLAILDRWWPSEQIYAGVYRGGTAFPSMAESLDGLAMHYGACYCIARRKTRFIQIDAHRISTRNRVEMYPPDENIGRLHDWYTTLYGVNSHRSDWFSYNLDSEGGDVLTKARYLYKAAMTLAMMQIPHNLHYSDTRIFK